MADINVQRRRISVWPWILGLFAAALLIWALAEMLDGGAAERNATAGEVGVREPSPPPIGLGLRVT